MTYDRFGFPVAAAVYNAEVFHGRPFPESETLVEFLAERLLCAFCDDQKKRISEELAQELRLVYKREGLGVVDQRLRVKVPNYEKALLRTLQRSVRELRSPGLYLRHVIEQFGLQ